MSVTAYKWMKTPFGNAGTLLAIPETVQGDGSVSYAEGFGPDYALDPATQPAALNIPRDKSNQLYNDITKGLKYYQEGKIPQWISTADNGGTPFAYDYLATVLYTDGFIYQSVLAANTDTPGATANWVRTRIRLAANTNFYVRTDGNDSNTGLANTAGGAFLTGAGAMTALARLWDINGYQVTLNFGTGTFAGFAAVPLVGAAITTPLLINGNGSANTAFSSGINISGGSTIVRLQNFSISSAGFPINASSGAQVYLGADIKITGAGAGSSSIISQLGSAIQIEQNISIAGNCASAFLAQNGGVIFGSGVTITYAGTPVYSVANAWSAYAGQINLTGITFAGAVTGVRFSAIVNGIIFTNGGGASYYPGNSAGTTATGGQYV